MWGTNQRRNNAACLVLTPLSVTSLISHKWIVSFQVLTCRWVGLCTFYDPVGLSDELSCETGSFSHHHNTHIFFTARGFESLVSRAKVPGFKICLTHQLFLPAYLCANVGPPMGSSTFPPGLLATTLPHPLHPSCLSPLLLPVWMNVSLTSWSLDFHANDFLAVLVFLCFYMGCYPSFVCVRK